MRKRTILMLCDKVLWGAILLLPVVAFLLAPWGYSIGGGTSMSGLSGGAINLPTFSSYLAQFGLSGDNVVYQALKDFFGTNGVIHFFYDDSALLLYFTYFVSVELVHLVIDFILFIPRLAHKWLSFMTGEYKDE